MRSRRSGTPGHADAAESAARERAGGSTPEDNVVMPRMGTSTAVSPHAVPHWEIPGFEKLFDFSRGAKVTGAGFPFYVGDGARIVRALLHFFLEEDGKAGYTEVSPPIFVNAASATATGQLPDKEGQMYETTPDHLYAVPTAEVPLTNFFRDEISMKPRCRSTAAPTPLFPPRGRQLRQGCARPEPPAPVRQGGAAEVGAPVDQLRGTRQAAPRRRGCCRSWSCPTACC
jgi:hypothetical protein